MIYTAREVYDFVRQEDVKFIRLAFCDVNGKQKNISIMPDELPRAFSDGISFDASAIKVFARQCNKNVLLDEIPRRHSV